MSIIDSADAQAHPRDIGDPLAPPERRRIVHTTPAAPAPIGPYSQASQVGSLVAAAGQVGVNPETGELAADLHTQTDQALHNVRAVLAAAGLGLDDVLRVDVHLSADADWDTYNAAYELWFPTDPPARTTVRAGLAPGVLVEVTVLAVVPAR